VCEEQCAIQIIIINKIILSQFVFLLVLCLNDTSCKKVSEEVNKKLPARNTTLQLLTLYTDLEHHNAHRYRRTDRRHYDVSMAASV